jgi:hypothetical protein
MTFQHDTLIFRIKHMVNCFYVKDIFVFYDYKTKLFGIRGQYFGDSLESNPLERSFSFDSSDVQSTLDFLSTIFFSHHPSSYVDISLLSCTSLPILSKTITRDLLVEYTMDETVSTYLTTKKSFTSFPRKTISKYLHLLLHVYMEY